MTVNRLPSPSDSPGPGEPPPAPGPAGHAATVDPIGLMGGSAAAEAAVSALERAPGPGGRRVYVRGSQGSSTTLLAGAIARRTGRPVLLVVAHLDEADEGADELVALGAAVIRLPALEVLPGETGVSSELFAQRLGAVRAALELKSGAVSAAGAAPVILAPVQALMQPVPSAERLGRLARTVRTGDRVDRSELTRWLDAGGYERVEAVDEVGQYAVRGDIVDVFPPGGIDASAGPSAAGVPVRIDFFDDVVERLSEIDLATMASDRVVTSAEILCADASLALGERDDGAEEAGAGTSTRARKKVDARGSVRLDASGGGGSGGVGTGGCSFLDHLPAGVCVVLHEPLEVTEQARGYFERLTDPRMFGPPTVLARLQGAATGGGVYVEVAQFSGARVSAEEEVTLPVAPLPEFARDAGEAVKELAARAAGDGGTHVEVFCQNGGELTRLGELLDEFAPGARGKVAARVAYLHRGFIYEGGEGGRRAVQFTPYHEMVHRFESRRRVGVRRESGPGGGSGLGGLERGVRAGRAIDTFLDFAPGDYVVHRDHGIALFHGLVVMKPREVKVARAVVLPSERPKKKSKAARAVGAAAGVGVGANAAGGPRGRAEEDPDEGMEEYLILEFAARARMYVPATKIDQVQKYVGGFRGTPQLSTLGGQRWKKQKEAVSESVKDLAGELLRVRAARESMPGIRYPGDTAWQKEFEAEFPFDETEDQLAAIAECKKDMMSQRPMDRLLCGDVGYGKTEVAMRAAFKAAEFGKQVAVLVPTTVLAEQHERTFKSRMAGYPFRVESVSRFKTSSEANAILADVRKGHVDVVIGTHRLLSKDVKFADLGLVIIDEEQRFGVEHKEKLLGLRMTVDVLTLSATPIPRTLHMSMLGLRDISSLTTAPVDRRAIVTEVIPYNQRRIQQAIQRELARDGQVFFVHNRVFNIMSVADEVQKMAPGARIVIGHGQMPDGELEEVMMTFMRRQADILVSTTIIESGIDIPTANTMIINDADRFGLAELHQLRGRVGRYKHRAYCYMLLSPERTVTDKAVKRLKAIEEYSMLGAGFKIAMRDLEIRGAGNILGPEQSGHIAAVGYEMYCQLLDTAVKELKHEPTNVASETSIELGVTGMIPKRYIASDLRRMGAYRRIASAQTTTELDAIEREMSDAYGKELPPATRRLLELAHVRVLASALQVRSIAVRERDVLIRAKPGDADRVGDRLKSGGGGASATRSPEHGLQVTVLPPATGETLAEVYVRPPTSYMDRPETMLRVLRARLGEAGTV